MSIFAKQARKGGEAHCPKCGSLEYRTITWELSAHKSWYVGDDYEDSKYLDGIADGVFRDSETICCGCGYEGLAPEWGAECETPLQHELMPLSRFEVALIEGYYQHRLWLHRKIWRIRRYVQRIFKLTPHTKGA